MSTILVVLAIRLALASRASVQQLHCQAKQQMLQTARRDAA
jgi:hypothetical protein